MAHQKSFFHRRQKALAIGSATYVLLLVLFHSTLPAQHVWLIAAFFSIAMNFTYITEAYAISKHLTLEMVVATVLIALSFAGAFYSPLCVIAAIFGHGVWDIAKHRGAGVPFLSWFTLGCFAVDTFYSGVLLIYWFTYNAVTLGSG